MPGGSVFAGAWRKAQTRFAEEQPQLSEEERNAKVNETAAVRTGAQLGASALATAATAAAIGSVVPVGGTAVGFVAGLAVGAAMMIPTGDDKTAGDRIGEFGEGVANKAKDVWGGIFG